MLRVSLTAGCAQAAPGLDINWGTAFIARRSGRPRSAIRYPSARWSHTLRINDAGVPSPFCGAVPATCGDSGVPFLFGGVCAPENRAYTVGHTGLSYWFHATFLTNPPWSIHRLRKSVRPFAPAHTRNPRSMQPPGPDFALAGTIRVRSRYPMAGGSRRRPAFIPPATARYRDRRNARSHGPR